MASDIAHWCGVTLPELMGASEEIRFMSEAGMGLDEIVEFALQQKAK